MKLSIRKSCRQAGNVILVALIITGVAGLTLASYLMMTQQQNVSIYRSQFWNSSMVVTEAGIEDGLQLINLFAGTMEPTDLYKWTNSAGGAGWDHPDGITYHVQRSIPAGGQTNTYEVWIYNTNNMPSVYAVGTIPWTFMYASAAGQQPMFAQINASPVSTLTRKVLVQTRYDPLFVVAMAALQNIDLNGRNIRSDSYDSADPLFSLGRFYPYGHPEMTRDNGDIATDAAVIDSLALGNAHIRGHVRTGPGTNTINLQNASVGDYSWVSTDTAGIQPTWSTTDFNVRFDRVQVNTTGWLPLLNVNFDAITNTYRYHVSVPGNYTLNNLDDNLLVDAPSNSIVNIYVNGQITLNGSEVVRITDSGAQLRIYAASVVSLTGQAWIDNQSGQAQNFYLFGMPTCTSITFGGNASFTGGIYAPQAAFYLGGGGSDTYDFIGSSVTRSVRMNGHYNFHFDENLARIGPSRGYIPIAWMER